MSHSNTYRCPLLPSYQLYYFVEKKSDYTCANYTPTGFVDLSPDGVDVLINGIKEHLVRIETINNLLREENHQIHRKLRIWLHLLKKSLMEKHLRGENIQIKNNLKVEKTNDTNRFKDLETKIKNANRIIRSKQKVS